MNMNYTAWTEEDKKPKSKFISIMLFITFALFFWGVKSDFVPSKEWMTMGSMISLIITIPLSITYWHAHWTGKIVTDFKAPAATIKKVTFLYLGIPAMFLFLSWASIIHGLASGINLAFGTPYTRLENLKKDHDIEKFGCDYHLKGEYLKDAFPQYMCITKEFYEQEPKSVQIKLTGKKTYFGFLIEHAYEYKPCPNLGLNHAIPAG